MPLEVVRWGWSEYETPDVPGLPDGARIVAVPATRRARRGGATLALPSGADDDLRLRPAGSRRAPRRRRRRRPPAARAARRRRRDDARHAARAGATPGHVPGSRPRGALGARPP